MDGAHPGLRGAARNYPITMINGRLPSNNGTFVPRVNIRRDLGLAEEFSGVSNSERRNAYSAAQDCLFYASCFWNRFRNCRAVFTRIGRAVVHSG